MQITIETDYAVRCMVYLKDHRAEISGLASIAAGTLIPKAFLSKILQKMIKGGFVRSIRGKKGGFRLTASPERVSVYNIMQAVCAPEPVLRPVCSKSKEPCVFLGTCKIHAVWENLAKVTRSSLHSSKLSAL